MMANFYHSPHAFTLMLLEILDPYLHNAPQFSVVSMIDVGLSDVSFSNDGRSSLKMEP